MLPLGSELWTLRHDPTGPKYVPRCEGTVEGVRGGEYLIAGRWQTFGYPHWGSRAEADRWILSNPMVIPTIKK